MQAIPGVDCDVHEFAIVSVEREGPPSPAISLQDGKTKHPVNTKKVAMIDGGCFSLLLKYYSQVSFNFKAIFYVAKITQNAYRFSLAVTDDRFVMKQMSRQELQCFLEFAPHYFRYINKALDEQVSCSHVTR